MKRVKSILLVAAAWLAVVSSAHSAHVEFVCPDTCSYASSLTSSTSVYTIHGGSISDITGAPVYDPLQGVILANSGEVPTADSQVTVEIAPIKDSLWVIGDSETSTERFQLWVGNETTTLESLGTFYDSNSAIDISSWVLANGPVTQIRAQAMAIDTLCQIGFGAPGCVVYDNPMGILAFAGVSVSAVPVPAAAWLFGSGLLGLVATGRRKRG